MARPRKRADGPTLFDTAPEPGETWPRLSRTLTGPKVPDQCQNCGGPADLGVWREHDEDDKPGPIVVVLCLECSDRLIVPHPRLYGELDRNEPWPGVMTLCINCAHRAGVTCPRAKVNGGPGMMITAPNAQRFHVSRSPRSQSGFIRYWPSRATECSERIIGREGFSVVNEEEQP